MIIVSDSELFDNIVHSIFEFNFGDYGFDAVNAAKEDPKTRAWIYDLAHKIERDWCNYVDGL